MIQLKSSREIEVMVEGGRVLAETLDMLRSHAHPGVSTLDLDTLTEDFIRSHAGAVPAFKGLYGFPGSLCASINSEIVHGIPSKKRVLRDGDIVSLDVGVLYGGLYTDSAITVGIGDLDGDSARLLAVTKLALAAGIAVALPENHVGDIGAAIQGVVEQAGFTTARDLVGHGVGTEPHGDPQVPNFGKPKRGTKLTPGLTIAIEPMVNAGTAKTKTMPDGWTVVTADGRRSAHFEHTVAITETGHRILTQLAPRVTPVEVR